MKLTFVTDLGQTYSVEIDPQMELENIMALLEAECGIPVAEQSISFEGRDLSDPSKTVEHYGIADNAMLLMRRRVLVGGRSAEQDAEMMRLQVLGDPQLMQQLRESQPELARAAQSDPRRFAELLSQTMERQHRAEQTRAQSIAALNADPFDIEAQRRIEEAIRQEAVMENMAHALEYSPESFGRVTMLYIPVEVNGKKEIAFVDSGAQSTIISPSCAERCGIMRLLDQRFSGIAKGVGTAQILGRVHSAQLRIADLHLACSFTVMEGRDVDLLFGLDMLKAHQACIDLEKNVLRIQGREVAFLPEHELPEHARNNYNAPDELANAPSSGEVGPSAPRPPDAHFPGGGHTLGGAPAGGPFGRGGAPVPAPRPAAPPSAGGGGGSRFPEAAIRTLMALGATREEAVRVLEMAGGNVDMAASMLF